MFTMSSPLSFPSLVLCSYEKVPVVHKGNKGRKNVVHKYHMFMLDWTEHDQRIKKRHERNEKKITSRGMIRFHENLPKKYTEWLQNLRFALSESYEREIRRNAWNAQEEWNIRRPFDTVVREHCLRPAIQFVNCAFYLLCDCIYDEQKKYWSRFKGLHRFAVNVMLYKFWAHQTGRGLLRRNAEIDKIERMIAEYETLGDRAPFKTFFETDEERDEFYEFLDALKKHEEEAEKCYDVTRENMNEGSG